MGYDVMGSNTGRDLLFGNVCYCSAIWWSEQEILLSPTCIQASFGNNVKFPIP